MGVPINRMICASNTNNILTEFLTTGCYDIRNRVLQQTTSPAIDILVSSNLERLLYHVTNANAELVRGAFQSLQERKRFDIPSEVHLYRAKYICII